MTEPFLPPMATAYTRYWGGNIKQMFCVTHYTERLDNGYPDWRSAVNREVLVGMKGETLRLRYPSGSTSGVQYLNEASQDLKSLGALLICGLLPAGVFADRLEEEFPAHSEAAVILRDWEKVKHQETQQ